MRIFPISAGLTLLFVSLVAYGGESPQFRGPNRDGHFDEQGLLKQWPDGGPPLLWVATGLGQGYASASVARGKIYVPGMQEDQTGVLFVLNSDGVIEKKIPYGKETLDDQAPGPRSTPTIEGDRVYLFSGLGVVYCLDVSKGEIVWEVDALKRFHAKNSRWNIAESLLLDGDRVICTPGGPDALLAALDKTNGETVWTTKGLIDQESYCSPAIVVHNGRRILLTETGKHVVGINPDTGELLWRHIHFTAYDIHAVTPIYSEGLVYFTGGYASGGGALELSPDGASVTLKWKDTNLDCQHHGVVLVDGYLYGTSHKQNRLMCLEMATGNLMWSTKEVTLGVVVYADGMLYVYEGPKSGVVSLVKAQPSGFERTGTFTITEGTDKHWAHPTIANGCLYIRHGDALLAYDVRAK